MTMDIAALYQEYLLHKLICTDTRKIAKDCIFFALKGDRFNGNDFASEAIAKGAAWAVVDEHELPFNERFIFVKNALETLQQLARFHRKEAGFKILAITGSNGKTTTKDLCKAVLSKVYQVYATEGNLNNHIGVPLSLLSMESTTEMGIIEMGANHHGEIEFLCGIADPDYGLITNIGKAHLEGFGGIEGVTRAKGELFTYLMEQNKTLIINQGDPNVEKLAPDTGKQNVYYNGDKGIHSKNVLCKPYVEMDAQIGNRILNFKTRLVGRYNTENILAACCVGMHLGIPDDEIIDAINRYQPEGYRSQFIVSGNNHIFMDAYNANPSSMLPAITEFLAYKDKKKLLILGEMKEIGNTSKEEHEVIISYLKDRLISDVVCIGESFETPAREAGYLYFSNVRQFTDYLNQHPVRQRSVFIKGSRSNQLEKILELL